MVDPAIPRSASSASDQLHALTAHTVQLLSMLEVVRMPGQHDATYVIESAVAMESVVAVALSFEPSRPIDPAGRSRASLQLSADKTRLLHRAALDRVAEASRRSESMHIEMAMALERLAAVCDRLHAVTGLHDHPFERAAAPGPAGPGPVAS